MTTTTRIHLEKIEADDDELRFINDIYEAAELLMETEDRSLSEAIEDIICQLHDYGVWNNTYS